MSHIGNTGTLKKIYFATSHSIMKYIILGKVGNSTEKRGGIYYMKEKFQNQILDDTIPLYISQ